MIMSWIKSCFNVLLCLMFSAVTDAGLAFVAGLGRLRFRHRS